MHRHHQEGAAKDTAQSERPAGMAGFIELFPSSPLCNLQSYTPAGSIWDAVTVICVHYLVRQIASLLADNLSLKPRITITSN